ncbi:hypothetical protein TI39_contig4287g00002 [Zymoseptoria brevis]|uniref:SnoaL-like domain-containing protein n=1 Tax=Zymoseptoria brevis TaxID=1047168 RepID=A0A0F4GBN5_9PEZI|nr:hypothetical protein TI39_contig4287g00002 [Zymoseptoria brevis]
MTKSSSTTTTSHSSPSSAEIDNTTNELKTLTLASLGAFNTKDFTYTATTAARDFESRISPNFTAELERVDGVLSWADLIDLWRRLADSMPDARFEVENVDVDVFEYGRASVFVETRSPVKERVRLGHMMVFKWVRDREGVWRHCGFTSIGGSRGD